MTAGRRETAAGIIAYACATHHEDVAIEQDTPLPIDIDNGWLDRAVDVIEGAVNHPDIARRPAKQLATIAYDLSRTFHQQLCLRGPGACRTDTKTVSDLTTLVARVFLHLDMTHGLRVVGAQYLEAPYLDRRDAIDGLEAALAPLLHEVHREGEAPTAITTTPVVQVNTAISDIDDDNYLALRRLAVQLQAVIEQGPFSCQVTSDFVTPATRAGFVSEASVRARIYRASALILFSKHAGDGTSIAWMLAEELNIPTLVLRETNDRGAAARFPGQLSSREVHVYESADEAVSIIGDFLTRHRLRIESRARQVYDYNNLDTSHLVERMNQIDPDAFDASSVTWERARFFVESPVHWFQAPRATCGEISKVLGLGHPKSSPASIADETTGPAVAPAQGSGISKTEGSTVSRTSSRDRRHLSTSSVRALMRAAEVHDISWEDMDRLIHEWEHRPGVLEAVSPRDRGPNYEGWVRRYEELER